MKIGIFDSGLGGLVVTKGIINQLPSFDTIYLGDTARVPYGNRSQATIYEFTLQAVDYLFKHDCQIIIVACNTASAEALRKIQQEYLPQSYPDRRVLGVLIPAAEAAVEATVSKRVGILATQATVSSNAFEREIHKLDPSVFVFQNPAPLLVPLIENDGIRYIHPVLRDYLAPLLAQSIDTLILGSTHYSLIKDSVRQIAGPHVTLVSADETTPEKLKNYLDRHRDHESKLTQLSNHRYCVTDLNKTTTMLAQTVMKQSIHLELVSLN